MVRAGGFGRPFALPEAINWGIANQLGRRNLGAEEAMYLRGKRYELEMVSEEEHKRRTVAAMNEARSLDLQNEDLENDRINQALTPASLKDQGFRSTAIKLGSEMGVSPSTVEQASKFSKAVDKIGAVNRSTSNGLENQYHENSEDAQALEQSHFLGLGVYGCRRTIASPARAVRFQSATRCRLTPRSA